MLPAFIRAPVSAQDKPGGIIDFIKADLERHASFGDKFSGGPGDIATADWIAGRLQDSGFSIEKSYFDSPFFIKNNSSLHTLNRTTEVVAQAPVVVTGKGGVNGRLVLIEKDEDITDISGNIALILTPYDRHAALFPERGVGKSVNSAVAAGAVAVIVVTRGPSNEAVALNSPENPFVPVPMAVLAPRAAGPVIDAARSGKPARLIIDGEATHRPCMNITGRVDRGDHWLVFSTPRSGWYNCVAERGTGTAVFLQLADWAVRRFPDLSIFVMNTGGHEYFFAGSHHVLDKAPPADKTLVWAHIGATLAARDAVERNGKLEMLDTADPGRSLMATDPAMTAARAGFRGLSGLSEPGMVRSKAGELSTFTDRGYRTAFAVIGMHHWFHTVEDTLDRVDAGLLLPVLQAHQRTIELIVSGV